MVGFEGIKQNKIIWITQIKMDSLIDWIKMKWINESIE